MRERRYIEEIENKHCIHIFYFYMVFILFYFYDNTMMKKKGRHIPSVAGAAVEGWGKGMPADRN